MVIHYLSESSINTTMHTSSDKMIVLVIVVQTKLQTGSIDVLTYLVL